MILITGDKGFIGNHLKYHLTSLNKEYIGFDLQRGQDIRNRFQLEQIFLKNNIDYVIHLAARAGVLQSELYPDEYISTNITGTYNLLDLAKKYKVKNFIFASSSSVYGGKESAVKENDELDPKGLYAQTKVMGENLCKQFSLDIPVTILRFFTVYGEYGRGEMSVSKFIRDIINEKPIPIFGTGNETRGYTYIDDIVDGIYKSLEKEYKVYNLGGHEEISINSLIAIIEKATKKKAIREHKKRHRADVKNSLADCTLAKLELGFKPKNNFKHNIHRIIKNQYGEF